MSGDCPSTGPRRPVAASRTARRSYDAAVSSRISAGQVRAFRLARQHLTDPLPAERVADVVSAIGGVQAQVMSAAELALAARSKRLTPGHVQEALWQRRELVKTWCMRGTLHLLPARELGLWTAALSRRTQWRVTPGCAGSAQRWRRWSSC